MFTCHFKPAIVVVLFCILLSGQASAVDDYDDDPLFLLHKTFSTKTTYNTSVFLDQQNGLRNADNESASHHLDGCHIVHVSSLFRHGVRYPGTKDLLHIRSVVHKILNQTRPAKDSDAVDRLVKSAELFSVRLAKELAPTGRVEHWELGQRHGDRFSKVFTAASVDDVDIFVSSKSRAIQSSNGFQEGILKVTGLDLSSRTMVDDLLLRFFDACNRYVKDIAGNKSVIGESKRFRLENLANISQRIALRLGLEALTISTGT